MNTLKIIEGQREEFNKIYPCIQEGCDHNGTYPTMSEDGCDPNPCRYCCEVRLPIWDWHKQSIIQILQSEIERKRGMKKEYSESFHVDEVEKNQAVKYKNHGEVGFNRCLQEDIAYLTNLIDNLK